MSKKGEKNTRAEAQQFNNRVRGRTSTDLFGGATSAFGPTGLVGQRNDALSNSNRAFNSAAGGFEQAQATGGYSPDMLPTLRQNEQNIVTGGGYDPTELKNIEGGYQNFADTGGFSDADKANFRRRATSSVPAIYDVLSQEAERQRSLNGGLGTGGEISQMARQMGQQASMAATNGEVSLADQIRQGKLAGLGGLQTTETNVAAGRRQGVGQQAGTESDVAHGSLQASQGLSQLYNTATNEVTQMGNQILAQYGLEDASDETKLKVLQSLSGTPGVLDNIQRIGGMVSGGLGAIAGMGGGGN